MRAQGCSVPSWNLIQQVLFISAVCNGKSDEDSGQYRDDTHDCKCADESAEDRGSKAPEKEGGDHRCVQLPPDRCFMIVIP